MIPEASMSPARLALAAALAALLALERKAFLQAMLARPLVACGLLGLALGVPSEALLLGAALELFFLGTANLGANVPDQEFLASAAGVSCLAFLVPAFPGPGASGALAIAAGVALLFGKLGQLSDRLGERYNERLLLASAAERDLTRQLGFALRGLWLPALAGALAFAGGATLGLLLRRAMVSLSGEVVPRALGFAWLGFLAAAGASAVRSIRVERAELWAGGAAALVAGIQLAQVLASK